LDGLIFISVLLAKEKENDIVDKVDGVIADLEALLDKTLI
jgi:hypothetical protein